MIKKTARFLIFTISGVCIPTLLPIPFRGVARV
jgi:hypothetical protein